MSKNPYCRTLICDDCSFVFQVYSPVTRGKTQFYCPSCGEYFFTRIYTPERNTSENKTSKIRWKKEELALLEKVKSKELAPYQVAIMTGRSINSVTKKLRRV